MYIIKQQKCINCSIKVILNKYWIIYNYNKLLYMNLCNFCTHFTFDLILRLGGIFRLCIHPSVFLTSQGILLADNTYLSRYGDETKGVF